MRKNPKDPRHFQFKDEIESEEITSTTIKGVGGRGETMCDQAAFLNWARQDLSDIPADDMLKWDQGALKDVQGEASSSTDMPAALAMRLGIKKEVKNPFEKDLDNLSNVADEATSEKILAKVAKLKAFADKVMEDFRVAFQGDKKAKSDKNFLKACGAKEKMEKLQWDGEKIKVKVVKEVMQEAATALKKLKEAIDNKKKGIDGEE